MEVATVQVQKRDQLGRNKVSKMRDDGFMPGVLYGGGRESLSIALDHYEMSAHLRHHLRVYKLEMDGAVQAGYLKEVQWDVLTDEALHVDFVRIELDKPLQVEVELSFLGHPKGASKGGTLVKDRTVLGLACLPASIPEGIEVNIADVDVGGKIVASDLDMPEGCTLDVPPETVIVHMPGE